MVQIEHLKRSNIIFWLWLPVSFTARIRNNDMPCFIQNTTMGCMVYKMEQETALDMCTPSIPLISHLRQIIFTRWNALSLRKRNTEAEVIKKNIKETLGMIQLGMEGVSRLVYLNEREKHILNTFRRHPVRKYVLKAVLL